MDEQRTPLRRHPAPDDGAPTRLPPVDPLASHASAPPPLEATDAFEIEVMPEGEEHAPPGTRTMAPVRWALVVGMAVAAAATGAHYFGLFDRAGSVRAQALFHCPMHPSVLQDHPGECPICGMDLVAVESAPKSGEPGASAASASAGAATAAAATTTAPGHAGHRHEPNDSWFCPMHPEETGADGSARCPTCNMKLSRREPGSPPPKWMGPLPAGHEAHRHNPNDPFYCPMHPEETAPDAAGRCPVCEMKLEKRDPARAAAPSRDRAAAASSGRASDRPADLVPVDLSPERIQLVGMKTATARRARLASEIRTVGTLTTTEDGLSRIQTRFSGWIETLRVAETGGRVAKGEVLATVYSPELLTAQQEFLNARRWAANASSTTGAAEPGLLEDARRKLELLGVSPREIAAIGRTGKPLRALAIRSPVAGYVVEKNAVQGLYVQPGTELFQVADLSKVWLLAEVYEYEVGRVRVGQRAQLELAAYAGESFTGTVQFVYPVLDPETRTLRVRLAFKNPELKLKPGMYGDVVIEAESAEGVVVPREAVVDTGHEQYVFLARDNGRFEPRRVTPGLRSDDGVEIVRGLAEGDRVVTTGNFLIDSESRLRAAVEGMAASPAADTAPAPPAPAAADAPRGEGR